MAKRLPYTHANLSAQLPEWPIDSGAYERALLVANDGDTELLDELCLLPWAMA